MQRRTLMTTLMALLALLVSGAWGELRAQDGGKSFKPEELDQMLAPIALYNDALLSQVLMAATYPLEVVEAARWVKANPNLKGDAAVKAVQDKTWDTSVKSLTAFPQVLVQMSDQLEWTQKLGDAMLGQQKDVAASIQRLRRLSYDAGNLKPSEQQKVNVQPGTPQTIVIEPATPQTIYVPIYQPSWAYGAWPYAGYPPYYHPPPPGYGYGAPLLRGFMFGVGVAAAGSLYGGWNWGSGDVNINVNRAVNIDRNFNAGRLQGGNWQHLPDHRKGVGYRDAGTRARYGKSIPGADGRRDFRGKDVTRPGGGPATRPAGGVQRPGAIGPQAGGQRPGGVQRPAGGQRPVAGSQQGGALGGVDRGGQRVSREAARGRSSAGGGRGGGGGRR
jgi:hypothetical protein